MMIVIGIILALVAIALPTAFSLISNSRATQTKATMNTIAAAIEQFGKDNPFARNNTIIRQITVGANTANYRLRDIFDRYPPSPTAAFSINPDTDSDHANQNAVNYTGTGLVSPPYPATRDNDDKDPPTGDPLTETKFLRLIYVMNGEDFASPDPHPWIIQHTAQQPAPEKYASIECLVYALREFSPGARDIIDKLPSSVLTNLDKDYVFHDTWPIGSPDGTFQADHERQATLFEIVDAWKRPLRWAIRERWQPTPTSGFTFKWELRSAGEDGVFSPPFTEESRSDDVVLQGP